MWIEHDGSGMPVPGDTLVYVKCGDGYDDSDCESPERADFWHDYEYPENSSWLRTEGYDYNIVAYRVVS